MVFLEPIGIIPRRGQSGYGLCLLGRANRVIDAFQQERKPDPSSQAERQSEGKIARHIRFGGIGRDSRFIDVAYVVRSQARGYARFLEFLHQAFVKRAITVQVALQQTVLDGALIQLIRLLLLLLHRLAQHALMLKRSQISAPHPRHDLGHFHLELSIYFFQLSIQLHNFWKGISELGSKLRDLDL
jgi:hypothetical protein